jgi:hypothetical protein
MAWASLLPPLKSETPTPQFVLSRAMLSAISPSKAQLHYRQDDANK